VEAFLVLPIVVADIYVIVKVLQSTAPVSSMVLWIAVILILPVIGLIAWYLMGPGRNSATAPIA
jgi:hypothetical protein